MTVTTGDRKSAYGVGTCLRLIWSDLTEDKARSLPKVVGRVLFSPRFHLLLSHRIGHLLERPCLRWLNAPLMWWQHVLFGCAVSPKAVIGRRVMFRHPLGVVIGEGVVIEDDVTILQHVTLGSHGRQTGEPEYPTIKQGARVFAGATVAGGVTVGKGAIVGAGAVLLQDAPDGAVAVGVPAEVRMPSGDSSDEQPQAVEEEAAEGLGDETE